MGGAAGEHDGAVGLAAAVGDARLTEERLRHADRAGGGVGDDQAQRLQRELVVARLLGAVRDLGGQVAVLLVGVQRMAEGDELAVAIPGEPVDVGEADVERGQPG